MKLKQIEKKNLFDKKNRRHNNNLDSNLDRPKQMDKEYLEFLIYRLDLGFLPKELLYNDKTTYGESTINLIAAIEILENALDSKEKNNKTTSLPENKSFWSDLNPFKCASYR